MKAMLALLFGLALTFWGGSILIKPFKVKAGSISYLLLTGIHLGWKDVQQKASQRRITQRQIRFWATLALIEGLILLLAALAFVYEAVA